MWLLRIVLSFTLILFSTQGYAQESSGKVSAYLNGNWFNGSSFEKKNFYSVGGTLTEVKPPLVGEAYDFSGKFIIPPLSDTHAHHFDSTQMADFITKQYLTEGIFYARSLTNTVTGRDKVSQSYNHPFGIDVTYSNGGFTSSKGHPILVYESLASGIYDPAQQEAKKNEIIQSRKVADNAYFITDNEEALAEKWPIFLKTKPDIVKVYLSDSENHHQNMANPQKLEGIGFNPDLLPALVEEAKESGLNVVAHVDTAFDFKKAVEAGVDEITHIPGYYIDANMDEGKFVIPEDLAKLAAKRNIIFTPTISLIEVYSEDLETAKRVVFQNIKTLKTAGVQFSVAADQYGISSSKEAFYWQDSGLFSNLEILKAWTEIGTQIIFPDRKIGKLREGYESSFLVLERDPTENLEFIKTIYLRVKEGNILEPK